jgi:hypothetical protein
MPIEPSANPTRLPLSLDCKTTKDYKGKLQTVIEEDIQLPNPMIHCRYPAPIQLRYKVAKYPPFST